MDLHRPLPAFDHQLTTTGLDAPLCDQLARTAKLDLTDAERRQWEVARRIAASPHHSCALIARQALNRLEVSHAAGRLRRTIPLRLFG